MLDTYSVNTPPPVFLLIDGAHMLRRNMYVPSMRELSNAQGMPTGAIYGFINSLRSTISSMSAQSVVVAWEGGHSERRLGVYEHYKERDTSGVQEVDIHGYTDYQYYKHQLSWIQMILDTLGVHQIAVSGKEGDDVIFQLSRLLKGQKIIISEDSDFFSLIREDISVYRPIKKTYVDLNNFEEITGLTSPKHYLYYKVLAGDGSDNIPAVAKGVGWKTIQDVLSRIDENDLTPYNIIKTSAGIKGSRYSKLADAGTDVIIRNLDLIDISREKFNLYEVSSIMDELKLSKSVDIGKFNKICGALEFNDRTLGNIVNKMTMISTYNLDPMIDKDYIKRHMLGTTSILQG